jgi:4-azaleucine resistance transporter AzlC
MTTTISKHTNRSHRGGAVRSPRGGYFGRGRGRIRPGSIAYDLVGDVEGPKSASPRVALVSGARTIAPVLLALLPFGVAFGATATESGLSALEALGMSVFIAAGAAQLAVLPLLSAGASVAVVVLTVLIINLRLMLYSASLAPHFRSLPLGWKGFLSYHLTDQAYAATITRFDAGETREPDKRWYYLGVGLSVWTTWQAATMTGVFLGAWASEDWSLDFVLPLIFIALAVPAIKDRTTGATALAAGVAALVFAVLPLNLGLIAAALVGIAGGLAAETLSERSER